MLLCHVAFIKESVVEAPHFKQLRGIKYDHCSVTLSWTSNHCRLDTDYSSNELVVETTSPPVSAFITLLHLMLLIFSFKGCLLFFLWHWLLSAVCKVVQNPRHCSDVSIPAGLMFEGTRASFESLLHETNGIFYYCIILVFHCLFIYLCSDCVVKVDTSVRGYRYGGQPSFPRIHPPEQCWDGRVYECGLTLDDGILGVTRKYGIHCK